MSARSDAWAKRDKWNYLAGFGCHRARCAPVPRFSGAFGDMGLAVDDLKIGQAPIGEELRPRLFAMRRPDLKQWHAVVDLSVLPQQSAALAATPRLQTPQQLRLLARRIPKLPGDHAGAVPCGLFVGAVVPQVDMPAESIDRLTAHAAKSRSTRKSALAIGRRWRPKRQRQSALAIFAETPAPAGRRAGTRHERTGQTVGAQRMGAPIAVDCKPWCRRYERPAKRAF